MIRFPLERGLELQRLQLAITGAEVNRDRGLLRLRIVVADRETGEPRALVFTQSIASAYTLDAGTRALCAPPGERQLDEELERAIVEILRHEVRECLVRGGLRVFDELVERDHGERLGEPDEHEGGRPTLCVYCRAPLPYGGYVATPVCDRCLDPDAPARVYVGGGTAAPAFVSQPIRTSAAPAEQDMFAGLMTWPACRAALEQAFMAGGEARLRVQRAALEAVRVATFGEAPRSPIPTVQTCPGCPHPAHLGRCTGRVGGTAYRCGCLLDTPRRA